MNIPQLVIPRERVKSASDGKSIVKEKSEDERLHEDNRGHCELPMLCFRVLKNVIEMETQVTHGLDVAWMRSEGFQVNIPLTTDIWPAVTECSM